ncbi:hypothetical protein BH11ARM2_BH11ARM2_18540 [soil metagenome]
MSTLIAFAALLQPAPPIIITLSKVVDGLHPVALAAAPTGARVAVALEDGNVRILDAATRTTLRVLAKHPQPCYALAWSNDGAYVATGDDSGRVWIEDARTGASVKQYRTHTRGVEKLSFDRTRRYVLSTGKDDTIKIYDLQDPKPKEVREVLGNGQNFYGGAFNPSISTDFVTGTLSSTGIGRVYNSNSGQVESFLTQSSTQGAFDTDYNPAGTRIASAGRDATVSLWDTKTWQKLGDFKGHQDWVVDVAFTPNGKWLASSSTDRSIRIWNPYSFQKVAEIDNQSGVGSPLAFTGDGKWLLTVNDMGSLAVHSVTPPQPGLITPTVPKKKSVKKTVARKPVRKGGVPG